METLIATPEELEAIVYGEISKAGITLDRRAFKVGFLAGVKISGAPGTRHIHLTETNETEN